jgi:ABC-type sulfate/molybdate transport systems ATPase subunit/ABC-type sulfate transport system permease component
VSRWARSAPLPRPGVLALLGTLLALYLLVPIVVLLVHVGRSASSLPAAGLGAALIVSVETASIATAIIAFLGIPLAWRLARGSGRLWEAVGVAVQLPLALPPLMSGIVLVEVLGPYTLVGSVVGSALTDTRAAIVAAQTFVAAPFLVVAARSAFESVDPALLEVSATLGHGRVARFWRVGLPVAAPGIRAGMLLSWLRAFGEFGATVILAYHPYSLPVLTFVQFSSTGLQSALAPTAVTIGAAMAVLTLVRIRPLRRLRARLAAGGARPAPDAPKRPVRANRGAPRSSAPPGALAFALRERLGGFELRLEHHARSPHLAVLGPSGAGKSLMLRCLAGLRGTGVGEVALGSRMLGHLPPERRRVGWMPQDAALIPGLTVWRQVTFGVQTDPAEASRWLERLGIASLSGRLPGQISGGQRQRVALARALAGAPDLLLLDEPLSALDRPVREELRRELRRLQHEVGIATVLVTHDPEEAALLAEEVIVLDRGRALQAGPRAEVFSRPASAQVARLLAIENLRDGRIVAPGRLLSEGSELAVSAPRLRVGSAVSWCVRSEQIEVLPATPESDGAVPAVILDVIDLGAWRELPLRLQGGLELTARTAERGSWMAPGGLCGVRLPEGVVTIWAQSS